MASGTTETLYAVWGSSATDVWAVGARGTILRWRGSSWAPVPSGTANDLYAVWGSGGDVWVSGANGTVLKWRP